MLTAAIIVYCVLPWLFLALTAVCYIVYAIIKRIVKGIIEFVKALVDAIKQYRLDRRPNGLHYK